MKRKTLLTLGLLAIFMLSACTPTQAPAPPPEPTPVPQAEPAEEEPVAAPEEEAAAPAPTAAAVEEEARAEVVAQPTSRGNELVATDPTTVNIASGQPQLIEFFAFW